ncbi:MAG: DUF411 domain-containing protein [Candidatus Woesearchaeota archaeon]
MKRALLLMVPLLILVACTPRTPTIESLSPGQFEAKISDRAVFVIDTHTPEGKHIVGTDAFIAYDALEENRALLPTDKNTPIAVYCRSGTMSAEAAQTLQKMGYTTVYDMDGGTNAWDAAGKSFTERSFGSFSAIDKTVTVYKSPSCGCCVGYVAELEKQGFEVKVVPTENMAPIKEKYSIPSAMESCHTSIVGGYVVEGHVPIDVVNKLLDEQPAIEGIALPRMPVGTPGMPGRKTEPWHIYSLNEGVPKDYLIV